MRIIACDECREGIIPGGRRQIQRNECGIALQMGLDGLFFFPGERAFLGYHDHWNAVTVQIPFGNYHEISCRIGNAENVECFQRD